MRKENGAAQYRFQNDYGVPVKKHRLRQAIQMGGILLNIGNTLRNINSE